jgi:tetratricopeptide (TPR) repeat protein
VWAALVAVLAFAAFASSLPNEFVYDDLGVIRDNPRLDDTWNLRLFFTAPNLSDADGNNGLYRPLFIWSLALLRAVFGAGPFGVHLANVVVNGLLAAAVYALVRRLVDSRPVAIAVALLYGLHPVHTEVVANGVGLAELGAALFGVLAALAHFAYVAPPRGVEERALSRAERRRGEVASEPAASPGRWLHVVAIALYFVALCFKESVAVLPALLLVLDFALVARGSWRVVMMRLGLYVAYAIPLVLFLILRQSAVGGFEVAVQETMAAASLFERWLLASEVLAKYVTQLFLPLQLCAEYSDYRDLAPRSLGDAWVLASLGMWLALAGVVYVLRVQKGWLALAGIAWFFVAILPVSNLLFPIGTARADRLVFLPSLGFALALGALFGAAIERSRWVAWGALVLVVAGFGVRSATRSLDWRTQDSLWRVTLEQNPGAAVGWTLLGDSEAQLGKTAEAEHCYRRAIEVRDGAGFFYPEAHNKLAASLLARGERDEAESHYRLVVTRRPQQFVALCNLGEMLLRDSSTRAESIELLRRAVAVKPAELAPRVNLSQALKLEGRFAEGLATLDAALPYHGGNALVWELKADLEQLTGNAAAATQSSARARQLRGK